MKYTSEPASIPLDQRIKESITTAAATKTIEWAYERESRILTFDASPKVKLHPKDLGLVIFGYKATDEFISKIYRNLQDYYRRKPAAEMPEFAKMIVSHESFKMTPFRLRFKP